LGAATRFIAVLTIGFVSLIGAAEVDNDSNIELLATAIVDVVVVVAAVAELNEVTSLEAGCKVLYWKPH